MSSSRRVIPLFFAEERSDVIPDEVDDDVVPDIRPCPLQVVPPEVFQKSCALGEDVFYDRVRVDESPDIDLEIP